MKTLLEAIATEEGYYVDGSRAQRNNNPGDLLWCPESRSFGATHGDPRFAVFPFRANGWSALKSWLSVPARFDAAGKLVRGYLGATLGQIIFRFAPNVENDSVAYLASVCAQTGYTPETVIEAQHLELPTSFS